MIFADKLIELRKKNGWSQEELAEKLDVSRQSVSKWEGAQSVPDMGRILRLSELFGVSTDYLLKDELETVEPAALEVPESAARVVTMEEANAFLALRERNARFVALGVMMCILSPVLLILLSGLTESGKSRLTETSATGLGLMALFLLIAGAVALFVISGIRSARFDIGFDSFKTNLFLRVATEVEDAEDILEFLDNEKKLLDIKRKELEDLDR